MLQRTRCFEDHLAVEGISCNRAGRRSGMPTHYVAVERAQLFHGRIRGAIRCRHRTTPCHRHWHICAKDGAILTHQFRDPNFNRPGTDEIEWRTGMPGLQPQDPRFGRDVMLLLKSLRQPLNGRILEKLRNIHIHAECLVDFSNDPNRQQ